MTRKRAKEFIFSFSELFKVSTGVDEVVSTSFWFDLLLQTVRNNTDSTPTKNAFFIRMIFIFFSINLGKVTIEAIITVEQKRQLSGLNVHNSVSVFCGAQTSCFFKKPCKIRWIIEIEFIRNFSNRFGVVP